MIQFDVDGLEGERQNELLEGANKVPQPRFSHSTTLTYACYWITISCLPSSRFNIVVVGTGNHHCLDSAIVPL